MKKRETIKKIRKKDKRKSKNAFANIKKYIIIEIQVKESQSKI